MRTLGKNGFTIVEMLVTTLVATIVMVGVGAGMVKMLRIESLNREKARALEELCFRHARTQPLVAVGASARRDPLDDGRVDIGYPFMVFGIACETNEMTQVTNTAIQVREDNVLQTIVMSGTVVPYNVTNAMPFVDSLVDVAEMSRSSVAVTNGLVRLAYGYRIHTRGGDADVSLAVPIRMRNTAYGEMPEDDQ